MALLGGILRHTDPLLDHPETASVTHSVTLGAGHKDHKDFYTGRAHGVVWLIGFHSSIAGWFPKTLFIFHEFDHIVTCFVTGLYIYYIYIYVFLFAGN